MSDEISKNREFLTVTELADILGISRVAVFYKIKNGQIKAEKAGRDYIIYKKDIRDLIGDELTDGLKKEISLAVDRVVEEYGDTLKELGKD